MGVGGKILLHLHLQVGFSEVYSAQPVRGHWWMWAPAAHSGNLLPPSPYPHCSSWGHLSDKLLVPKPGLKEALREPQTNRDFLSRPQTNSRSGEKELWKEVVLQKLIIYPMWKWKSRWYQGWGQFSFLPCVTNRKTCNSLRLGWAGGRTTWGERASLIQGGHDDFEYSWSTGHKCRIGGWKCRDRVYRKSWVGDDGLLGVIKDLEKILLRKFRKLEPWSFEQDICGSCYLPGWPSPSSNSASATCV